MKELFEILVKKRTSVLIVLLAIFVAMVVTYLLSRLKNRFIKFIPAFILIIVGTVFLADGWTNILTARGINSLCNDYWYKWSCFAIFRFNTYEF